jgi:hypothetical protein
MYYVYLFIALITGFFIGRMRKKKKEVIIECDHEYKRTFSTCKELDLQCRFDSKDKKMSKEINVLYSICTKCKNEVLAVGDGTGDTFYFDELIYLLKMRQLRDDNELKISMKIQVYH